MADNFFWDTTTLSRGWWTTNNIPAVEYTAEEFSRLLERNLNGSRY